MRRFAGSSQSVMLVAGSLLAGGLVAWPSTPIAAASVPQSVVIAQTAAGPGILYGIAATSSSNAWAVGGIGSFGHQAPLIMHWKGKKWARVVTPSIKGSARLNAVAATSAANAWAVGAIGTFGHETPLILHWNGRKWARVSIPSMNQTASLAGVAAQSKSNVWAVGSTGIFEPRGKTLIMHWNGRRWRVTPSAGAGFVLNSTTFSTSNSAWAVGNSGGPAGGPSYIARWNGKVWKQVKSPSPGGRSNILNGIAITSQGRAWAVGGDDGEQLILHWNGTAWKQIHAVSGYLSGITVASGSTLWAVGQSVTSRVLVEKWNGTVWKQVANPVAASNSELFAVAATSASNSWAVGCVNCFASTPRTLILHWNGRSWK